MKAYSHRLREEKIFQSMSRKGNCLDNSVMENFFGLLKQEIYYGTVYYSYEELKVAIEKYIKYYPSFVIFKDGKIIDYLEADNDEDIDIYNSEEAFKTWLSTYIKLPSKKEENNVTNDTTLDTSYDINLDNVVREKNKVNIYLFWGDGCPHCKKEKEFFESIKTKYGKYYNLYTFEVWYNEENLNILNAFASSMGEKVTGVPYTIIGSKTFKGFNDTDDYKQSIIKTIEEEKDKNYDVYFDKIKK